MTEMALPQTQQKLLQDVLDLQIRRELDYLQWLQGKDDVFSQRDRWGNVPGGTLETFSNLSISLISTLRNHNEKCLRLAEDLRRTSGRIERGNLFVIQEDCHPLQIYILRKGKNERIFCI